MKLKTKKKFHLDTESEEYGKEYVRNLGKFSELETMIIRSHLLTEHSLDVAIQKTVLHGEKYESDRFTFYHKVVIAEMLGLTMYAESIRALNTLRNQIAHNLRFESKYVDRIINEKSKDMSDVVVANKLSGIFAFINGKMSVAYKTARTNIAIEVEASRRK